MNLTQSVLVTHYFYIFAIFRYNHFVSSSALVSSTNGRSNVHDILGLPVTLGPEVPTASPTSGHLSIILSLLADMLSQVCAVSWLFSVGMFSLFCDVYQTRSNV